MYTVEICNKKNVPDVFGHEIKRIIRETGIEGIEDVLTSEIYRFDGISYPDDLMRIARDILVDAVAQEYFTDDSNIVSKSGYSIVDVFYKRGVTDSVADTVVIALKDAGIKAGISVSTGKRYYLKGDMTEERIRIICEKILVNPLIQEYSVIKRKQENV